MLVGVTERKAVLPVLFILSAVCTCSTGAAVLAEFLTNVAHAICFSND